MAEATVWAEVPLLIEADRWESQLGPPNRRLLAAVQAFGWGPRAGPCVFRREGHGWRLGNGVVISVWEGRDVPEDAETALSDIEEACLGELG